MSVRLWGPCFSLDQLLPAKTIAAQSAALENQLVTTANDGQRRRVGRSQVVEQFKRFTFDRLPPSFQLLDSSSLGRYLNQPSCVCGSTGRKQRGELCSNNKVEKKKKKNKMKKQDKLTDCSPGFIQLGQDSVILLDFGHDPLNVATAVPSGHRTASSCARQLGQ